LIKVIIDRCDAKKMFIRLNITSIEIIIIFLFSKTIILGETILSKA